MSVNIHLMDDFYLTADKYCWIIERRWINKSGKNAGKEKKEVMSYHPTIDQALTSVLERALRSSDVHTMAELLEYHKMVATALRDACTVTYGKDS